VLFTRGEYEKLQSNLDIRDTHAAKLIEKKEELNRLNKIKADINSDSTEYMKYVTEIKEDELIDYIYTYVESTNSEKGIINIKNINISEPKKNELGFTQTDLAIQIIVSNEATMNKFLDFLTSPASQYNFFLDSFSYPNDGRKGAFSVNIPLKIFYK
jgi:uncharacterized protein YdcH (DUF465 family)